MATTLLQDQALAIVKNPTNKGNVKQGLIYESRLRVYTEPLDREYISREVGYTEITDKMLSDLGDLEKARRTLSFMDYPLQVVNVSAEATGDINKVFSARNANFETKAVNPNQQDRCEETLKRINVRDYIETTGKEVLRNKPNTFVVVDKDEQGNPYLVTVDNNKLEGYKLNKDKTLDYIVFEHSTGVDEQGIKFKRIALYDCFKYWVYEIKDGNYTLISDNEHNLGYCPAFPFIGAMLNSKSTLDKWNPFSSSIAELKSIVLNDVYITYASLYCVFPILEAPATDCLEPYCDDGVIKTPNSDGGFIESTCKSCSKSRIIGAGTVIDIDVAQENTEKDSRGVTRFISPDISNIEYAEKKQEQRRQAVKRAIAGVNQVIEKEAVNESQVLAVMEDRRKLMLFIAEQLNTLHMDLVNCICALEGIEVVSFANYGTEWFLVGQAELQELFKTAKENGIGETELMEIYYLLMDTKYKNNPKKAERVKIEADLNPAIFKTLDECYAMRAAGVMTKQDLTIKANFVKYLKRFERENGSVVEFGMDAILQGSLTYDKKIEDIYNQFIEYSKKDESNEENNSEQAQSEGRPSDDREGV